MNASNLNYQGWLTTMKFEEKYKTWIEVSEFADEELNLAFPNWSQEGGEKYDLAERAWSELKGRIISHFKIQNMSFLKATDLEKAKETVSDTIQEYAKMLPAE